LCSSRATKELHRPLGDALFLNVKILARIRLRYVFTLSNQGKWRFGSFGSFGKRKCLGVGRERIIIVTAVLLVGRTTLWVAPNAIFQDIVPHKAAAHLGKGRVRAHEAWVHRIRVSN
jgi:hypothetical protein